MMKLNFSSFIGICLVLILISFGCRKPSNEQNSSCCSSAIEGTSSFTFSDYAPLSAKPIEVFYHIPPGNDLASSPILFVFSGNNRNASEYRDAWISLANQYNILIFAPEFSSFYYPGSEQYMEGNVFDSNGQLNPENIWTFSIVEPLFEYIKNSTGNTSEKFDLFGHSAGAQFVHRYVIFKNSSSISRAVASNSGWYTVPDSLIDYPYGIGNTLFSDADKELFFSKKLIVHLGENDNNPNDPSLRKTPEANAQGAHRLARGNHFFSKSEQLCNSHSFYYNWEKIQEPNIGHNYILMSEKAAEILY